MIKQVFLFRRDLNMRKGKIASQVAHASLKVFFDRGSVVCGTVEEPAYTLSVPLTPEMAAWIKGIYTKIVLSVESEADLLAAFAMAQAADIPCALIRDLGATEFHGVPTHTVLAIGPAEATEIDRITGPDGGIRTSLA